MSNRQIQRRQLHSAPKTALICNLLSCVGYQLGHELFTHAHVQTCSTNHIQHWSKSTIQIYPPREPNPPFTSTGHAKSKKQNNVVQLWNPSPVPVPLHCYQPALPSTRPWWRARSPSVAAIGLLDVQLLVAWTEQCQPTTASHFCYLSPPNFSVRKTSIFFVHVLVVASNPREAVLHSRSLKLRHHHHLFPTFTHTQPHKAPGTKSQNDTNKTHLSYNNPFHCKMQKFNKQ